MKHLLEGLSLVGWHGSAVFVAPILVGFVFAAGILRHGASTNGVDADALETTRQLDRQLGDLLRPAIASSVRVRATGFDVATAIARSADAADARRQPIPALHDWIEPLDDTTPHAAIRFQSVGSSAVVSPEKRLELMLDSRELANGTDDDGDGLIDEGDLVLFQAGEAIVLVHGVERFEFTVFAGVADVVVQGGQKVSDGMTRWRCEVSVAMRNR